MDEEIEAKGEMSKVFQGGEEPRAPRLELAATILHTGSGWIFWLL